MALETGDDYYNYYSSMMPWGNQGTGTTNQGTGITQLATPGIKYPPQGGGGGGGFQLPQNYYQAPMTIGYGEGMVDRPLAEGAGLTQTNQGNNFFQNLNFPGKQFIGAGLNKLKMGLGSVAGLIGGALPKMSPQAAANQRWAVDGAGYGTGTQRDQFGMLVGQSLMDPSRTYEDRLAEREDELAEILESQKLRGSYKKTGWHQKQLDHINQVNEIKEKERIAKEKAAAQAKQQWQADYANWQSPTGRDHAQTAGIGSPESKKGVAPGQQGAEASWKGYLGGRVGYNKGGRVGILAAF